MTKLDDKMQKRLDEWRAKTNPVAKAPKAEYGDNISDFAKKELEEWQYEVSRNSIYRR